jgi:ribosomal protein L39E
LAPCRSGAEGDARADRKLTSRAELIPGDAIAGARKKIDNFLPSQRDGGIVFQKGQEARVALFIDVRAYRTGSQSPETRKWRRKLLKSLKTDSEIAIRSPAGVK